MTTINGTSGDDTLLGTSAAETIYGGDGNDVITGGAGNDEIYGGKGTDTASFSGTYSNYNITTVYEDKFGVSSLVGYSVAALSGTDGTDLVFDVEYLTFSSGSYRLDAGSVVSLNGSSSADAVSGSPAADTLYGYAGNDSLTGGSGDDILDGGDGVDTASYVGNASNFQLSFNGTQLVLQDLSGSEGTDQLTKVELLQFADRLVHVESRAPTLVYTDLPQELYHFFIVAFGATPGVTYMDQLAEAYQYFEPQMGQDAAIQTIVNIFTTKSQYLDLYPDISTLQDRTNLVEDIVKSSASATAKAAAVQDIGDALAAGWSVGKVIYTVFGNLATKPQTDATWGGTAKQFANELAVAEYYTETLNQSTDDVDTLRDVIKLVGADSDVSTNAAIVELIGVGLLQA